MKNIFISTFKVIAMQSYAQVTKLVSKVLIARILSIQSFGILSLILHWASLLVPFLSFGTNRLITKIISETQRKDEGSKALGIVIWSLLVLMMWVIFILLVINLYPHPISLLLNVSIPYLFVIIGLAFLMAFLQFQFSVLNGLSQAVRGRLAEHLLFPTLLIAFLGYCYYHQAENLLDWIITGHVIIYSLSAGLGVLFVYKYFVTNNRDRKPSFGESRAWLEFSSSNFVTLSSQTFLNRLDLTFIGVLLAADSVALYAIPSSILNTLSFFNRSFNVVLEPKISYFHSLNSLDRLLPILRLNIYLQFAISLIFYLAIFFLGDYVLSLFGATYSSMHDILKITGITIIMLAVTGPAGVLLTMTGNVRERVYLNLITLVISGMVYPLLIAQYQLIGAAYAFVLTMAISRFGLVYLVHLKLKINMVKLLFTI